MFHFPLPPFEFSKKEKPEPLRFTGMNQD